MWLRNLFKAWYLKASEIQCSLVSSIHITFKVLSHGVLCLIYFFYFQLVLGETYQHKIVVPLPGWTWMQACFGIWYFNLWDFPQTFSPSSLRSVCPEEFSYNFIVTSPTWYQSVLYREKSELSWLSPSETKMVLATSFAQCLGKLS